MDDLYTVLPPGRYPLLLAPAFWAFGQFLGETAAWLLDKSGWADYDDVHEDLRWGAGRLVGWVYVLFWVYGAIDQG